jgi:hypothetical protein
MQLIPSPRLLCLPTVTLLISLWSGLSGAHIVVQVRGAAQIDADVAPTSSGDSVVIRGVLRDELALPIAAAPLRFELARQQTVTNLTTLSDCEARSLVVGASPRKQVETSSDGSFCVQLPRARLVENDAVYVNFDGNSSYAATNTKISVADWRMGLSLDVRGVAGSIALDAVEVNVPVALHATAPRGAGETPPIAIRAAWREVVETGSTQEHDLGQIVAQLDAPTTLTIDTAKLGEPGHAELIFAFDGNAFYKPLRARARVVRTRKVQLTASNWTDSAELGERLSFDVTATAKTKISPVGSVELVGFDESSSFFRLDANAKAVLSVMVPRLRLHDFIELRFHSDAAGWQAGEPLRLTTTISPASPWNAVGWAMAAVLMLGWFVASRLRATPDHGKPPTAVAPAPEARVELLESATSPNAGWTGIVVDAHDGAAVPNAAIEVSQVGFHGRVALLSSTSTPSGEFEIGPCSPGVAPSLCHLILRANGYSRVELEMPPPGRIKIHLVSIRRTLLDRLVSWARRRGQPFDSKREPTPDWVAEVARARNFTEIEVWAKAVGRGAFGSEAPSDADGPDLQPPGGTAGANEGAKRSS